MEMFEQRMARYELVEGSDKLQQIAPNLGPGEQELIPLFHDESSFHHHEYQSMLW